jgi:predicted DNA-binding transcriptional regulator AlpA
MLAVSTFPEIHAEILRLVEEGKAVVIISHNSPQPPPAPRLPQQGRPCSVPGAQNGGKANQQDGRVHVDESSKGEDCQPLKSVLRTPQAAEYVGLSASTLEKYRLYGTGPPYQKAGGKIIVYRPEDLDAWLNARRRRSTSDQTPISETGAR